MSIETLADLSAFMVKHGLVIRAIPMQSRSLYDLNPQEPREGGTVMFIPEFHREMNVVIRDNAEGGKFIMAFMGGNRVTVDSWVRENGKIKFFDTMDDALAYAIKEKEEDSE